MTDTKSLLQSTTIRGLIITIISALAPMGAGALGYTFTAEDGTNLMEMFAKIGELVGSAIAFYGRIKATKQIG
jgi:hypothetical protein